MARLGVSDSGAEQRTVRDGVTNRVAAGANPEREPGRAADLPYV